MSHFYASINGGAYSEATRCGTKDSGIGGHIRGWNVGIRVVGNVMTDSNGKEYDTFAVYLTGGSNGAGRDRLIGHFDEYDVGR